MIAPVQDSDTLEPQAYELALKAVGDGRKADAAHIIWNAVQAESCGRSRFMRRLETAQIFLTMGMGTIARPILEDLVLELEGRKLNEWESADTCAQVLRLLYECLVKLNVSPERREQLHASICRISPCDALLIAEEHA